MTTLSLFLLGAPRIESDAGPISVDTRKAIALIVYLAVTRQQQRRDSLAALFWPENDQSHARAALRRTLSTLNGALQGRWLLIERETIGLNLGSDIFIDVYEFQQYLAQCRVHGHSAQEVCTDCFAPLTEAAALYQDDFLTGFSLRDSPEFDDWRFYQADSLRREFASALERLVHCHCALQNFSEAITYARRWLQLDRLHEPAHRQLMQLYAWNDQRGAALHQYRECVQVLDQELGVPPLEATTHLYQLIQENHLPPLPAPLAPPVYKNEKEARDSYILSPVAQGAVLAQSPTSTEVATNNASFPFVGRGEELETLLAAYRASKGHGHIFILEGEAGIGKTRLAEEFLDGVRLNGGSVVVARCYEGETHLAYGPVVAALRAALSQKDEVFWLDRVPSAALSEVTRLLPELGTRVPGLVAPPPLDSPGAQSRFFEGIRQLLLALCGGSGQGILFFDDLHWADNASLELLSYLVRRLHEPSFSLLFAWRGKQLSRGSRLYQLFVEAQRSGQTLVLSLSRLSYHAAQDLIQAVLPPAAPRDFSNHLYAETEGIPFFLTEYLTAIEKGILNIAEANWSLPGGVRDLLHSRLSAVDEVGWQLLHTAASIGRSFDFDTLREVSGRSEEETVSALENLIAQGLVDEVRGRGGSEQFLAYDFSHEKLRTLVYEETSLARRRLLHRRIAEALASQTRGPGGVGPLAGQIAQHYRQAGNDGAAAEYFKLAGEYAASLYANAEALAHMRAALALGHPDVSALHEAIGDYQTLLGEYSAALRSYETAAALSADYQLPLIEHKLGLVYMRRGEWELAESHLKFALSAEGAENTGGRREDASIYTDWSLTVHRQGQTDRALELAQRGLTQAQATGDTRSLAQAHNILGMLARHQGNAVEARRHLEESLALARTLHEPGIQAAALNNLAQAYLLGGEIDRARALTEEALALCIAQGDRHREAALHSNLADLLHAARSADEAMQHLKQAVSIYAEIGVEAGTVQPEIWKLSEW